MKDLSIIIPVFNEDNFLNRLFINLIKYFDNENTEVIFINDGSTDNSKNIIEKFIKDKAKKFEVKLLSFEKNQGKGKAVREGMKLAIGNYLLLQDADLELDIKDSRELYDIIQSDDEIKCIFGSRYLSGKLKKNNYFFNQFVAKFNSVIFNLLFAQSLSDIHCGLKILHKDVVKKLNLKVDDFGLEIDIASQIVRNNFYIYEYGVSYYFRTKQQGKKITWIDGIKSYYYLFKTRFLDNEISTNLSILYSALFMGYVGSYFGLGNGKTLFMILFFMIGLFIGIKNKIFSASIIFLFIFIGSFFGKGQGKVLAVLIFFIIGIYLSTKLSKKININYKNTILKYLF